MSKYINKSYINENINKILNQTKYQSMNNEQIKQHFNSSILNIDYLIDRGDYIIAIYNNWRDDLLTGDNSNFVQSVEHILNNLNKPILAIYLSKYINNTSNNNFKNIQYEGRIDYKLKYISIYSNTTELLLKKLKRILYENQIYIYDLDGDVLMLH
jgi:hypothetical protein